MQTGISVSGTEISGNLKKVTGYTQYSEKSEEQSGNYIAIKATVVPSDAQVTVELTGGTPKGPVRLGPTMNTVLRITDKATQKIKVTASKEGYQNMVKTYGLNRLTVAP